MYVLKGHDHEVTHVQFSNCSGDSRRVSFPTPSGALLDKKPRGGVGGEGSGDMDSCVTCSRDGITIVWRAKPTPTARPGKVGAASPSPSTSVPPYLFAFLTGGG